MACIYRIVVYMAVLSAVAVGGGCTTGDIDGDGTADHPAPSVDQFRGQALASGLTIAQAANLQQRVDDVLASIPGGRQVSATELSYDGLNVTFDPLYSEDKDVLAPFAPQDIICSPGWFCIIVRGTTFSYTKCDQYWTLSNWWGNSPFKNNQTGGAVARFYDVNFNLAWANQAYSDGYVDVTPFWYFKPCSSPPPRGD